MVVAAVDVAVSAIVVAVAVGQSHARIFSLALSFKYNKPNCNYSG